MMQPFVYTPLSFLDDLNVGEGYSIIVRPSNHLEVPHVTICIIHAQTLLLRKQLMFCFIASVVLHYHSSRYCVHLTC